ncbi:MAG: hypothetical protein IJS58_00535 [Bacilli bacterium]|nr:hypothetical protein [Bacilli bacterium]
MKIQIRRNVFETNSSSMHSLVIRRNDITSVDDNNVEHPINRILTHDEMLTNIKRFMDKQGIVDFSYRNWYFGRSPFRIMTTFSEKVEYLLASYLYFRRYNEENQIGFDEAVALIKKLVPEVKDIKCPSDIGFDEAYYFSWKNQYGFSDEDFLTHTRYIAIQDGDEYGKWHDVYLYNLASEDVIEVDSMDFHNGEKEC